MTQTGRDDQPAAEYRAGRLIKWGRSNGTMKVVHRVNLTFNGTWTAPLGPPWVCMLAWQLPGTSLTD